MPNYRRAHVPGGTFFFTLVTDKRRRLFASPRARGMLREAIRDCQGERPFRIPAIVLLPDHLHAIWTLPRGDSDYSSRWGMIKARMTKKWLAAKSSETRVSEARKSERRRGVWQPRFWEHTLEDEEDFERHFDYIHYNPVKHGLVRCPHEWKWSSFHRWVKKGVYPVDWACWTEQRTMDFSDIAATVGE